MMEIVWLQNSRLTLARRRAHLTALALTSQTTLKSSERRTSNVQHHAKQQQGISGENVCAHAGVFRIFMPLINPAVGCCAADKESKTTKTRATSQQRVLLKNSFVKFTTLAHNTQKRSRRGKKRVCVRAYILRLHHTRNIK